MGTSSIAYASYNLTLSEKCYRVTNERSYTHGVSTEELNSEMKEEPAAMKPAISKILKMCYERLVDEQLITNENIIIMRIVTLSYISDNVLTLTVHKEITIYMPL